MARSVQFLKGLARWLAYGIAAILLLVVLALTAIQTGWAKNQLRRLIVSQANQYLTATLEIGHLGGSLVRGIELGDIRLARQGETLISIDAVTVSYSIRELFEPGTIIRRIQLVRPRFLIAKEPDGRWNLGALIRRNAQAAERRGPGRAIHILAIQVIDGLVNFRDELSFGAAHVPTTFDDLNVVCAFDYEPVAWKLAFTKASWTGRDPHLVMRDLTGRISNGSAGWAFDNLRVETPSSRFTLNGRVDQRVSPTQLALKVDAERFVFQEWSGILSGLTNIAIDAEFETRLDGPLAKLSTDLNLRSNGGHVRGSFVLDTTAPGWRGVGAVDVERIQLARWLNRADRPSDITGHVTFDLTDIGLRAGGRFPRGMYAFDGSHAAYLDYEADDVRARGVLTATETVIAEVTATAYGANLRVSDGAIGIDAPYRFRFTGMADGVDLRLVPANVPVPHVDSTLTFTYDVSGQFSEPFIRGRAQFEESSFLGATIGPGTVGTIDTAAMPIRYSGEGDLTSVDPGRFGRGLDVQWLQDPRYAGTLDGHFHVEGTGADAATMTLDADGRLARADLFEGRLSDADVTVRIHDGSLEASYAGGLFGVNPAVAMGDARYDASLSGSGRAHISVRDLLLRSPALGDYAIDVTMTLGPSRVRTLQLTTGELEASLSNEILGITRLSAAGPAIELRLAGPLDLGNEDRSHLDYTVVRADLGMLEEILGQQLSGGLTANGQLTGPLTRVHLVGEAGLTRLDVSGVKALTADLRYDLTVPTDAPEHTSGKADGRVSFLEVFGQQLKEVSGTVTYDEGRVSTNLQLDEGRLAGSVTGTFLLDRDRQTVDVQMLTANFRRVSWQLADAASPRLSWDDLGITIAGLSLVDSATVTQRITADGTWRSDGSGSLRVTGRHVSLDALTTGTDGPAPYGGFADVDAVIRGTRDRPIVTGEISVTDGRMWRVAYQSLKGRVDYVDGGFQIDLRLDQRPGVLLTATGRVPIGVFDSERPEEPIDIVVRSTSMDLGLLEGATSVVQDVSGAMTVDVRVIGTARDPHFDGRVDLSGAAFRVTSSGARYKNGRVTLVLTTDKVTVEALHLEDRNGHPLEVSGSLGTHELRVSDVEIAISARAFEVLRNEFGRMDIDAKLQLRGRFESPRLEGRITVTGGELGVDVILDHSMLQPYSEQAAGPPEIDAIAAINPWQRLGLGIELSVPNTLRMVGDNVQITPGTPLGLGSINLRALGDLYLYKDPNEPLYITGSLDSVTGSYSFQGRRFDLDSASSITFRGDLNPELYVTVRREISSVETRVTIAGPLKSPELRLASTPPLEASDILSLIVFNTSVNQLSADQQRDLVVRAGTLAAGFLAAPVVTALERTLGLDTLEIEPGVDLTGGTRVTIGDEIAPGLVARFSRQFGTFQYDEATLEYYLSRILRIRATFSDAGVTRSSFRRIERTGVDLLLFFSF